MKITYDSKPFNPIVLTITVESAQEAQALYAIANHGRNSGLLGNLVSEQIKCAMGGKAYVWKCGDIIANGITYEDFYLR